MSGEGQRAEWPKHCLNNNKHDDTRLNVNSVNNKNINLNSGQSS